MPHIMESGQRKDKDGKDDPAQDHQQVYLHLQRQAGVHRRSGTRDRRQSLHEFSAKVEESGTFKFTWTDDDGTVTTAEESITVS